MRLVKPSFEILSIDENALERIEVAGRTCYKSEEKMTSDSSLKFAKSLLSRGHLSVIEHANATVKFVVDRGVSHELVRHRLCAFSQESTRYCNYKGGVTFVIPPWLPFEPQKDMDSNATLGFFSDGCFSSDSVWLLSIARAEQTYLQLLEFGWTPQQARSVLPNSLKTEIVVTANMREWLHIFDLRTSKAAHPQMREIMKPLLFEFANRIPVLFNGMAKDRALKEMANA